jgi:hypothetical protein
MSGAMLSEETLDHSVGIWLNGSGGLEDFESIERDQNAIFARRDREQSIIGSADELLFTSECDIVARLSEHRPD